jgi:hypothetical protein
VRALGAFGDGTRVVDHLLHRDGQRRVLTLHDHSEGVADEQHIRSGIIEDAGEGRVVRRDHADLLSGLLQLLQRVDGDLVLHGSPPMGE